MKKSIVLLVLFSTMAWSQTEKKEQIEFTPEASFAFSSQFYSGDNYLSKGHNDGIGGSLKFNFITYKNFKLGFQFEKTTQKVIDKEIGGNISKTNSNSLGGVISYQLYTNNKIAFEPQFKIAGIQLRQKDGSKFYGSQNGTQIGISSDVIYKLNKTLSIFTNVGYNYSFLKVDTTPAYEDYFNNSQSINISVGLIIK
ncbi:hypothetical protein ACFSX9_11445 [Flavobacterium ardleyense]|uniref:Outer membrane protein beta-barrel domain-containing protein n=1 Tax=Flavobacterium ardleyense TaxID=2038737 RepID=A0ABW5ZA29_9FLAO